MQSYQELIELVKSRRSIRAFRPEPLPEGTIEKIIEAARWAPSGADAQPWEFIVIRRPDLKEKVVQLYKKAEELVSRREQDNDPELKFLPVMALPVPDPGFKTAPAFILLLGDPRTNLARPLYVQEKYGGEILISDLANAFLNMHLAARSLGLGSQWVSAMGEKTIDNELKNLLGIPAGLKVYDMMAVGYPAYDPGYRSPRDLQEMVHYDGFQIEKYRTDQQIREFVISLRKQMLGGN